ARKRVRRGKCSAIAGNARHVGVARGVQSDGETDVAARARKERGVNKTVPGSVQLGYKGVAARTLAVSVVIATVHAGAKHGVKGACSCREVTRPSVSGYVGAAGGIYADRLAEILPGTAAEIGGVNQTGSRR